MDADIMSTLLAKKSIVTIYPVINFNTEMTAWDRIGNQWFNYLEKQLNFELTSSHENNP